MFCPTNRIMNPSDHYFGVLKCRGCVKGLVPISIFHPSRFQVQKVGGFKYFVLSIVTGIMILIS
jgi:hypothetical protein